MKMLGLLQARPARVELLSFTNAHFCSAMNTRLLAALLVFSFLLPLHSCKQSRQERIQRETTAMGTFLTVTVYGNDLDAVKTNEWIDSAFSEIRRVEAMATDYNDSSEIGRINVNSGTAAVDVSGELALLIRKALDFSSASNGAFDIAVGPIVKAWDFLSEHPHVPDSLSIRRLLPLVDYRQVRADGGTVMLPKKGMALDLGAIAKGYAVDRAVDVLKRGGYERMIVDLGGNLGVYWQGTHMLDSTAAQLLIRHPRLENKFFGEFRYGSGGVSTSGDYQRYFIEDGVRYHHIIDPATGYPVRGVVSVTILAPNAMTADAISTLVFVLGKERGMEFIKSHQGVEGLIVYEEGGGLKYLCSPGLEERFVAGSDK
jgi:thiamine biosynthesis lipoprotein